jgi:hypothetical protein
MKSLKPEPSRRRDVAAPRLRRPRARRTLACASLALLLACALVSSTYATRTHGRGHLEGMSASPHRTLSTSVGAAAESGPRVSPAAPSAAGRAAARAARAPLAAPLFQLGAETIQTFAADCTTPQTTFNLGEQVCARVTNAPVLDFPFFPATIPLRRFSWINPAGLEVRATEITTSEQTDTFTVPADETTTFGETVVDNRGGWRVNITSIYDASERGSAPFTARKPTAPAVDLSVGTTLEQREGRVPAGAQAPFVITVSNAGPDPAAAVSLTIPVPNHSTFFGLTQSEGAAFECLNPSVGTGPSGSSICTIEELAPGARAVFVAIYLVGSTVAPETEVMSAPSITSTTTERLPGDNSDAASYRVAAQPLCTINTPDDITVNNDLVAGQPSGGAVVTYAAPTTAGNCGAVTCAPPSGSFFPVGETFVTCTNASEIAVERFRVTVNDTRTPTITCPASFSIPESAPGAGSAVVNFPAPTVSDNDPNIQVTFDPPSGLPLEVGAHPVTVTATDASGNTATCTFTVTVTPRMGACTITPDVANLPTITGECSAVATVIPTAVDSCSGRVGATTDDPRSFDEPGTYTIDWVYTSADGVTTATQAQTVVVTPGSGTLSITGAPNVSVPMTPGAPGCSVVISDLGAVLNTNIGGSCAGVDLTRAVSPEVIDNTYLVGTVYTVVSTVTNGTSTASITQTLRVVDGINPTVTAPADASYQCLASVPAADPSQATAADNCGTPAVTVSETTNGGAGSPASPLVITRTFTATDGGGRTASASQVITVIDTTRPVITLSGANPLTVECHTSFTDPGASGSDNCDTTVAVSASGSVDVNTPGTYTITYNATDAAGNAAVPVTRTVNVVDTTPPSVACPPDITVYLPLNSPDVSMPVSFAVTASDSCDSTPGVALSHASGSVFNVGTTTVTATATDDSGNSSSCSFNVTVLYNFTGFFSPVENPPTLNQVKAGQAIPVKFSLSGNKGLGIFATDFPASQQVTCNSSAPVSDLEGTDTAGGSTLTYDAGSDRYHYVWKTEKSWAGTCRQLVVKLNDGSTHIAQFKFK